VGARPKTGLSSVFFSRCWLGSGLNGTFPWHAEHDHGELACQRHLGLVGAGASGDSALPAFGSEQPLELGFVSMMWAAS